MKQETYILCAALWYDDGKKRPHMPTNIETGIVVCGHRHCSCFLILNSIFPGCEYKDSGKVQHGFLSSDGTFVGREVASTIAFNAGQTNEPKYRLFSEDLY